MDIIRAIKPKKLKKSNLMLVLTVNSHQKAFKVKSVYILEDVKQIDNL